MKVLHKNGFLWIIALFVCSSPIKSQPISFADSLTWYGVDTLLHYNGLYSKNDYLEYYFWKKNGMVFAKKIDKICGNAYPAIKIDRLSFEWICELMNKAPTDSSYLYNRQEICKDGSVITTISSTSDIPINRIDVYAGINNHLNFEVNENYHFKITSHAYLIYLLVRSAALEYEHTLSYEAFLINCPENIIMNAGIVKWHF